jgi:serine phosphatase RsbU (regulator of sigma subunit)
MATDGITEARQGTAFLGYDGLMRLAGEAQHLPNLDLIANCILDGARAFGNGSLRDDACVMLAQRR